jgi:hypothetical protein
MTSKKRDQELMDHLATLDESELDNLIVLADNVIANDDKTGLYTPNIIQEAVHACLAFIRCLFSGNGVGKTTACLMEAIWTCTGTHPHRETARLPNVVIIVLDDASKADSVYKFELEKRRWYDPSKLDFDKKGKSHTQEILFPNGSKIVFMSHQMDEEKFESIQAAAVIFDEPPPRRCLVALMRGQREKDMKPWIIFAGTPRGRHAPWMYDSLYEPWETWKNAVESGDTVVDPDIRCFFGSTHDNLQNLDPDTIDRWKTQFTEEELATRVYGKFEFLSGRIFTTFDEKLHVVPDFAWPSRWPVFVCLDPHLRKDHIMVLLGVSSDQEIYAIKELACPLAGRKACQWFLRILLKSGLNIKAGICDNFGSIDMYEDADTEEKKSFIKMWNEEAMKMNRPKFCIRPTSKKEKGDDEWIEDMRDYLRLEQTHEGLRPKFMVFKSCVKLTSDFKKYVWDEHTGRKADLGEPKEEPLGTNQDYLMCVKYGIAMKPLKMVKDKPILHGWNSPRAQQEYENHEHRRKLPWEKD